MTEEELQAKIDELDARQAEMDRKSAQFEAQSQVVPIVAGLVAKGAIAPSDQVGMVDVFTKLAMVPGDQFNAEFAAPKDGSNAAVSFLAAAIEKKAIPYGKDKSAPEADEAEFAMELEGDEDPSMMMDKKIKAHMKKNPGMSYGAAMEACAK
jgi:hypothetical protein